MVRRKGWHGESRRHSLARRGIKTAQKLNKKDFVVSKRTNVRGQVMTLNPFVVKTFTTDGKIIHERISNSKFWDKDTDKDGKIDKTDCDPFNAKKQDKKRKSRKFDPRLNEFYDEEFEEVKEQFGDQTEELKEIDWKIWKKLNAKSGDDIREKWDEYLKLVDKHLVNDINQFNYLLLEDENYHSLNEALEQLGKFSTSKKSLNELELYD